MTRYLQLIANHFWKEQATPYLALSELRQHVFSRATLSPPEQATPKNTQSVECAGLTTLLTNIMDRKYFFRYFYLQPNAVQKDGGVIAPSVELDKILGKQKEQIWEY